MPNPLTLEELVRTGGYRNSRHRDLLGSEPALPWPQLAELQSAYVRIDHPLERAEIAREFQRRVRTLADDEDEREARERDQAAFDAIVHAPPEEISLNQISASLMRSHGLTYRQIAAELAVSPSTARRLVVSLNQPR